MWAPTRIDEAEKEKKNGRHTHAMIPETGPTTTQTCYRPCGRRLFSPWIMLRRPESGPGFPPRRHRYSQGGTAATRPIAGTISPLLFPVWRTCIGTGTRPPWFLSGIPVVLSLVSCRLLAIELERYQHLGAQVYRESKIEPGVLLFTFSSSINQL